MSEYDQNLATTEEYAPWGMESKQFCMFMHLAQFGGYVVPFAGLILPIVMWSTNKDQDPRVDAHGKNILNWIISLIIYSVVGGILVFLLIGIPILIALFVCSVVFPILGSVKANNDEFFKYPLAITFIS